MITASSETILHGLKKYTNYSMEILAYTSGGDGVRSNLIHCQTDQDGKFGLLKLEKSSYSLIMIISDMS